MITKDEAQQLIFSKLSIFNAIPGRESGITLLRALKHIPDQNDRDDKEADLVDLKADHKLYI